MNRIKQAFKKFVDWCFYVSVCVLLASAVTGAGYVSGFWKNIEIKEIEKIVEVEKSEPDLEDLFTTVPARYNVPELLTRCMVTQESGGKRDAYRFEPGQMPRAAKLTKNAEQQRMLASSHGIMQVMGYNAVTAGYSWSDLYDLEFGFEFGVKMISSCLDRHKSKSRYEQIYAGLVCYNGGEKYANEVMGCLTTKLINNL